MPLIRRLNRQGIARARELLEQWAAPDGVNQTALMELLSEPIYSTEVGEADIEVEQRTFATRREAGEYLASKVEALSSGANRAIPLEDDWGLWSWLGLFYCCDLEDDRKETFRRSKTKEGYLFDAEDASDASRTFQRRTHHYLLSAFLLHRSYGHIPFLSERKVWSASHLEQRILGDSRMFNSVGFVSLLVRLYTDGLDSKTNIDRTQGRLTQWGVSHFVRVRDQLERTHDVYGMEPEALLDIFPREFKDRWGG